MEKSDFTSDFEKEVSKKLKVMQIQYVGSRARLESCISEYESFPVKCEVEEMDFRPPSKNFLETLGRDFCRTLDEESFRTITAVFFFPYNLALAIVFNIDITDAEISAFKRILKKMKDVDEETLAQGGSGFREIALMQESRRIIEEENVRYKMLHNASSAAIGSFMRVSFHSALNFNTITPDSSVSMPTEYVEKLFKRIYSRKKFSTGYSITTEESAKILQDGKQKRNDMTVIKFDIEGQYKIKKIFTVFPNPFFGKFEDEMAAFLEEIESLRKKDREYLWKKEFMWNFPNGFSLEKD